MSPGFTRPQDGWRYQFDGMNTREVPDALSPVKYPIAINVRATGNRTIQTRPGYTNLFSTSADLITDIRAYARLGTDNLPRYLARSNQNRIYLDTGALVSTLSGTSQGVCMVPYRPNASPQSWMYVAAQNDYRKLSAPDANDVVTDHLAGIQEPFAAPSAAPRAFNYYDFSGLAADWANTGTAGAVTDNTEVLGTAGDVFLDPASGTSPRYSVEVANNGLFKIGMVTVFDPAGTPLPTVVQDVLAAVNDGNTLTIQSIRYYDQDTNTGRCVIVPDQMPSTFAPSIVNNIPSMPSIFSTSALASLRRGSIVELNDGAVNVENVFVLSVTTGPDGNVAFECETVATYAAGHAITGRLAISVSGITGAESGQDIESYSIDSAVAVGTGTITQALALNPFVQQMPPSTNTPQQADYFHISLQFTNITVLTSGRIKFITSTTTDDYFYYDFTPASLSPSVALSGATSWIELWIPISELLHSSGDITRTLINCTSVEISIVTTGPGTFIYVRNLWLGGGGQPDVGEAGAPYFYAVRGRSSLTGALSNPSPITRYGVNPRRQDVTVIATDTVLDAQMDKWDVFRYGGTITSFRYIGSMPNTGGGADEFVDHYFDDAANSGDRLEYDNFQPWPTIGLPFNITAGTTGAGVTLDINVTGTIVSLLWTSATVFDDPTQDILDWLPGTLVQIGSQSAYTLRSRPESLTYATPPAVFYYAIRLELVENAGSSSPTTFSVQEPNVANAHLPYVFGPDATGTIFACGDPLRPGNLYYSKTNAPDSAPDTYNQELTPPSEPLIGGETLNGLAKVASTARWWALYPDFGSATKRYQAVEIPVGRGMVAPYGHCTDGTRIYFWAKDGIWVENGGAGASLTDMDLYNLFPHEGVVGKDYTYATYTIYAPDYKYAAQFRLGFCLGYLYADYVDSEGNRRTLTCDVRNPNQPRWCVDQGAVNQISVHYSVEQQSGTLLDSTDVYPQLILGDENGDVHQEAANSSDNGTAITAALLSFEFNGGDVRTDQFWSDVFLDSRPAGTLTFGPVSEGVQVATPLVIQQSAARTQSLVSIGAAHKYVGLSCQWVDDFVTHDLPTELYAWQPMFQPMPVGVLMWKTQGTSFGMLGFMHVRQVVFAYISSAEVTLTITTYDGNDPDPVTLPSTGGALRKVLFPVTFNKGQLYFLHGVSDEVWYPFLSDCEFYVGQWERGTRYTIFRDIEGPRGIGEGLNAPNRSVVNQ